MNSLATDLLDDKLTNVESASKFGRVIARLSFGATQRADTYERLANLLESVKLVDALGALYDVASDGGKKKGEGRAILFANTLASIEHGEKLGSALSPFIPQSEQLLISAGEESGRLPSMLKYAAVVVRAKTEMTSAAISETLTPFVLLLGVVAYLFYYAVAIIPRLVLPTMNPDKYQPMAKALIYTSRWAVDYGWILLPITIALIIAIVCSLPRLTGPLRRYLDYIPPWSIYKVVVGSTMILAITAMVKSKFKLLDSLHMCREGASPWLQERIDAGVDGVQEGYNLGVALREAGHHFPDDRVIGDLIIYSSSQSFDEALERVSADLLKNSIALVKKIAKVLSILAHIILLFAMVFITLGSTSITAGLQASIGH